MLQLLRKLFGVAQPRHAAIRRTRAFRRGNRLRYYFEQHGRNWLKKSNAPAREPQLQERQRQACGFHTSNVTCERCELPKPLPLWRRWLAAVLAFIQSLLGKVKP
jgi:hypothetical protein